MSLSDRINNKFEEWRADVVHGIAGWLSDLLLSVITREMEDIEETSATEFSEMIDEIRLDPETPKEARDTLDKLAAKKGSAIVILGFTMMIVAMTGAVAGMSRPVTGKVAQHFNQKIRPTQGTIGELIAARNRDEIDDTYFHDQLQRIGYTDTWISTIDKLRHIIPPLSDMVRFADFSAFDPEVLARWPEYATCPDWLKKPFALLGITDEWADKYWFSHFVQPGRFELGEMWKRGEIGEADIKLAYRTMGYSDFWQDKLFKLVKEVPTRVDIRRWWDMRTITEERMRQLYKAQGYWDQDLEDYITWTKVYVDFPDLMSRYENGWITRETVRSTLIADGMPGNRADELLQTKFDNLARPKRIASERDLAKSEIYAGVKKGIINWGQGLTMLQELGYDANEAEFILQVRVGAGSSPNSYIEFMEWIQHYKQALGETVTEIPEALKMASQKVAELKAKIAGMREAKVPEAEIAPYEGELSNAQYLYEEELKKFSA